jgi:hypothetical protein
MSRACTRLVILSALLLCAVASLPSGALNAQQTLSATARISPHPSTRPGPDSGMHFLSLEIVGIPEVASRGLSLDQILLIDEAGRAYTPSGIGWRTTGKEQTSLVAAYLGTAKDTSKPSYGFVVAPGGRTFELRVAGLKPVRVTALIVGPAR